MIPPTAVRNTDDTVLQSDQCKTVISPSVLQICILLIFFFLFFFICLILVFYFLLLLFFFLFLLFFSGTLGVTVGEVFLCVTVLPPYR